MKASESEIARIAREMIKQHESGAARAAVERLNEMIDRGDWSGRDAWAQIVHAIHAMQRVAIGNFGRVDSRGDGLGRISQ